MKKLLALFVLFVASLGAATHTITIELSPDEEQSMQKFIAARQDIRNKPVNEVFQQILLRALEQIFAENPTPAMKAAEDQLKNARDQLDQLRKNDTRVKVETQ